MNDRLANLAGQGRRINESGFFIRPSAGIFCNVMPCILENTKKGGSKIVTRYPGRKPSLDSKLLLFNSENGEFLPMIAGMFNTLKTLINLSVLQK